MHEKKMDDFALNHECVQARCAITFLSNFNWHFCMANDTECNIHQILHKQILF